MTKALTAAAVARLKPGTKRRSIRDAGARSLFLIIEPSGRRSWMMRFRTPSGRIGKMVLGPVDLSGREPKDEPQIGAPLTLAAARQLAAAVHRARSQGGDPIADHKARKHRLQAAIEERDARGFAAAARQFIEEHARPNTRRWQETARSLGLRPEDLSPIPGSIALRWGDKPVAEIDGHDIWAVVDEARRLGVPGRPARNPDLSEARGRALLAVLSSLFSWLQRERRVTTNPCVGILKSKAPEPRERRLNDDELRWMWRAAPAAGEPFGSIIRLLLLLGQRLNEVAGMRRTELQDDGMWHLPGSHVVPLPALAQAILAATPPGASDSVFTTNAGRPATNWSAAKAKLDRAMRAIAQEERGPGAAIEAFRLHDLRRTAVTGMAELKVSVDVIELVVNHAGGSRGGIAGVYNRSELLDERRAALERWAAHVERLVNGDAATKVVPFRPGRG